MACLRPPINTFPDGDWICHECGVVPEQTGKIMYLVHSGVPRVERPCLYKCTNLVQNYVT